MNADLIGAVTAVYIYTTSIVLFAARMGGNARAALLSGIAFLLSAIPLGSRAAPFAALFRPDGTDGSVQAAPVGMVTANRQRS